MLIRGDHAYATLRDHLTRFNEDAPKTAWLQQDPIRFPKRFSKTTDRELVGCFAALLAYGRVGQIGIAVEDLLSRMGASPTAAVMNDSAKDAERRFAGFVYRLVIGEDITRLWLGLGAIFRQYGSLNQALEQWNQRSAPDLRHILIKLRSVILESTCEFRPRKGFAHLLADPEGGSAIKRYNMLLRWMVRGPDEVDLGHWSFLGPSRLVLPLDTHVHRIAINLGLTTRRSADWKTAMEITSVLKNLSADDPTKFDFAIAHLGISGQCPSHRVSDICSGCPINSICILK